VAPASRHKRFTILAQALSSLTNLTAGVYAAHLLAPAAFGVFGLLQFAYIVALGILRSTCTDVAVVSASSTEPTCRHLGSVDAIAGLSVAGSAIAIPLLLAVVEAPPVAIVLTVFGMAIAMAQDCVRILSMTIGRGGVAAVSDGLWLLGILAVLPFMSLFVDPSPWDIAAAWTLTALPALAYGALALGWRPRLSRGWWFLTDQPGLSAVLFAEWSMRTGVAQVTTYALGLVGGIVTVAQIRASQILLGPLNLGFSGLQFALLSSVLAHRDSCLPSMRRLLRRLSLALGLSSVLFGALVAVLPQDWLAVIVGDQAHGVATYVLPLAATMAAAGFSTGSALGLRVLRAKRQLTRSRVFTSLLSLAASASGYLVTGSALGGLWGLAIGSLLAIALWERGFKTVYAAALSRTCRCGVPAAFPPLDVS
jgi:hypothetical protein